MRLDFSDFYLTDDRGEILAHMDDVQALLKQTFWACHRSAETNARAIRGSICCAVFDAASDRMVGFARAVTDYAVMYYLEDVIVDAAYRGRGIGKRMVSWLTAHEALAPLAAQLITRDAQGLYARYGFHEYRYTCMLKGK